MTIYFQPVQDVQISTQSSRSQYQYTLTGTDAAQVTLWSNKLVAEMRRDPLFRDVSSEAQEGGLRAALDINRQRAGPTRRQPPGRHRHAERRLRAAADFDHLRAGQPVSRGAGGACRCTSAIRTMLSKLYLPGAAGAQVPLSAVAT